MKKLLILSTLCASFAAFGAATADSNSESGSVASARGGDIICIVNCAGGPETQTIKNTPSVAGPNLTTSNDTCMGSASGGAGVPGIGLSFGTTLTDENCKMLKNARELWNMGLKAAAIARMCMDDDNRSAMEQTGVQCPPKKEEKAPVRTARTERGGR